MNQYTKSPANHRDGEQTSGHKKTLVVGAEGQIGYPLLQYLKSQGYYARGTTRKKFNENSQLIFLDLAQDDHNIDFAQFENVIICAGITSIAECEKNPEKCEIINSKNTKLLIEICVKSKCFVVFLSSTSVFDGTKPFYKYNDKRRPTTKYGEAKLSVEKFIESIDSNLVCVLRLTKVITENTSFIRNWRENAGGGRIEAFGNRFLSPIELSEVVRSITLLIERKTPGFFQLGGTKEMSYFEYAKSIFDKDLILKDIIVETEDTSLENFTYGSLTTHLPYSVFSHSFEGSDLIAQSLLRNVSTGMYVDVGAFHPKHLNNTYNFYLRGWSGIAIDADPSLEDIWVSERPRDRFIPAVLSDQVKKVELHIFSDKTMNSVDPATISRYAKRMAPSDVSVKTLNSTTLEILKDKYFPRHEIHLLSIDIEGEDLKCLIGANLKFWRPGLIVVETKNLSLYNISNNEIVAYLTSIGYRLIAKNLLDAFFIDPKKSYFEWIPRSLIY